MRFRRWPRPTAYRETPRKRAAFLRKQRLEREALPLFAEAIAARQHSVEEEMARRHVWWDEREHDQRDARAARWREARARLFALPGPLRAKVRILWRTCPYPADPASFTDFLHQIAVGRLDPDRPPWVFHQKTQARITANPATFDAAFRQIGRKQVETDTMPFDELLFCGNLGSGILFLAWRVRLIERGESFRTLFNALSPESHIGVANGQWIEIEVRGECSQTDLSLIERLAQASDTRRVVVHHIKPLVSRSAHVRLQAS